MYQSLVSGGRERILIEASLREPLLMPGEAMDAHALILHPVSNTAMVPPVTVKSMGLLEAMAEKFRAALSRREIAIRDFYDVDYAVEHLGLDLDDRRLIDLVRSKLAVRGNPAADTGAERCSALERQLDTRLRAVLRPESFQAFDLRRAIAHVAAMATKIARSGHNMGKGSL